jgi:hypothetical protein
MVMPEGCRQCGFPDLDSVAAFDSLSNSEIDILKRCLARDDVYETSVGNTSPETAVVLRESLVFLYAVKGRRERLALSEFGKQMWDEQRRRRAEAAPPRKPVAWMYVDPQGDSHVRQHRDMSFPPMAKHGWSEIPLYAGDGEPQ